MTDNRLEISNPCDAATIDCSNMIAARLAVLLIGQGQFGIIGDDDKGGMPIFLVGGHDTWFKKAHGMTVQEALNTVPHEDIANALDSVQLVGERTSLNDFTRRARSFAKAMRKANQCPPNTPQKP